MEINSTSKILPGSQIVGDIKIDENSSIWYNAVLRGDSGQIKIGKKSNVQDNCTIHSTEGYNTEIGDHVSIGHGAILHGCEVQDNVIVGMGAIILNGAKISKNSIVGAGSLITEHKKFPENSLILGSPAKVVRSLSPEEVAIIRENADNYLNLSNQY
ncbi:MAG: gamma carbonic anhydrase family protein [Methanobrevibacter sp.]|jgi:carbonic anhydrase/acetyltransferase-like protein (isoleucine patch superfamily)|nr:gamma carbonic anhydrase family protein [Methanobrevibacter sp.]